MELGNEKSRFIVMHYLQKAKSGCKVRKIKRSETETIGGFGKCTDLIVSSRRERELAIYYFEEKCHTNVLQVAQCILHFE